MDSELSPIGYHHHQQHIEPNGNRKFQEIATGDSYSHQTHPQVSYNPSGTSSDFSVSNRLLNTQQVHPKPYSFIDNNTYQHNYMNCMYNTSNNGWHLPPTNQIGTIRHQSPRYEPPPPNQTIYQLQNTQSHQSVLPKYEHHHFTPVQPIVQNNTLSHQASPSPAQQCDHNPLQASSPSNLSWNSIGYPYSNDNGISTLDNSIDDSPPKNGYSYSTSIIPEPIPLIVARPDHSPSSINGNSNGNNVIMDRPSCEEDDDSDSRSIIESDTSEHKKPKRTRTAFTNTQLDQLEIYFSHSTYPDAFVRDDISKRLHIKEDRIQVWFQNRRARHRKQERTGSVSIRSKARQQRIKRIKETQAAAAAASTSLVYKFPPQSNSAMYPVTNPQSFSHQFTFQLMTDPTPRSPVITTSSPVLQSSQGYPYPISNEALLPHQPAVHNPPPVMLNGHSSSFGASLDK